MEKKENWVLGLSYQVKLESGEVVDEATPEEPFEFITGIGQALETFEEKVSAVEAEKKFEFSLSPNEAYGDYQTALVSIVPRSAFAEGPENMLEPGISLPMMDADENAVLGVVLEVNDETVKMDFNHPLSGQSLFFSGVVISKRKAMASEVDLGKILPN